jgi:hypothetical protein
MEIQRQLRSGANHELARAADTWTCFSLSVSEPRSADSESLQAGVASAIGKSSLGNDRRDRSIRHLEDWAAWSRHSFPHLGYPRHMSGLMDGGAVTPDSADLQQSEACRQRCMIVDACVDDLPPDARRAVCSRFLRSRYIGRIPKEIALEEALVMLEIAFRRKAILW